MLKLELDWAGDAEPDTGVVSDEGDVVTLFVEYDDEPGAAGWPTVRVFASREQGLPAYYEAMALDAWLESANGYGESDEAMRQDLLELADEV